MALTVYLSSTLNDLEAEREAVQGVPGRKRAVKQSYGVSEQALVERCLSDGAECDLLVRIVGLPYGFVRDDGRRNPDQFSTTKLE